MKKILILGFFLVSAFISVYAQTSTIRGKVVDVQSKETLVGATVI